ncbi:MAG: type 3 dihydrofolate reductase [Opitutales bacterium]|tara:strand:- start:422 stop:892 length:471 start_codon:yes stop_codon:yes gene_type:complete
MNPCKAIAALSSNRVIGKDGGIPWHLPEDFKWFKNKTMGHNLLMGRKTYASIGKPLPGRKTFVLSTQDNLLLPQEVTQIKSIDAIKALDIQGDLFICGGAKVYESCLSYCSDLFLTWVKKEIEGDTFFPPFEHLFEVAQTLKETDDFTIVHYKQAI